MKIAHIIPYSIKLPLELHNGRYDWVVELATIQVKNGHDVVIYCHPDSYLPGIKTAGIRNSSEGHKTNNILTFQLAFTGDHDIYHSHFDNLHYEVAHETTRSIVFTQHWWPTQETTELAHMCTTSNVWAVPPTKYMYDIDVSQQIPSKGFIYHGIDLESFRPEQVKKNGRLLFVGRIAPEKNLPIAISAAKKSGIGLDIIGKVADKNQEYWESVQKDIDGSLIQYIGPKSHEELGTYYSQATALIFPSDTNEPFGLVAIESQLCGTPVIMKKGGSRGELIQEGKTGFLCESVDDFVGAITAAAQVSASDCVKFAHNFDVQTMAKKYTDLYQSLITT